MYNDDRDFYVGQHRPRLISYLGTAFIGALIGGMIVAFVMVSFVANTTPKSNLQDKQAPIQTDMTGEYVVVRIAEELGPTVVGISNRVDVSSFFYNQQVEQGTGSGVIFNEAGYIVTNYHVIQDSDQLVVTLSTGEQVPGKLVGTDTRTDLAVIKINETGLKTAEFGDSDKIKVGELAVAIGNPLGEELASTVTTGVISAVNRTVDVDEQRFQLIQTDAAINPGNSGGALVNSKGKVIGINSVKIVDINIEGLNFAIPSNTVKPIVESIIKNGKVIRPWIGIIGGNVNPSLKDRFKLSVNTGVFVSELPPEGPAAKAGIQRGDVMISFDGQDIKDFGDLRTYVDKSKIGDEVALIIMRGIDKKSIKVKLEQMPEE
ncbi:S1C family serine protease [Phosphitispora sp. TUW77]|uniref:S1C family serine protease n=1 Tax=Phosphitispora sp. TUW77 TaxID=3152361 RepID=UPI003AB19060